MVFQVLSGFRKNPDNIEQRGMFELLEIRRLQQFHFQDEILVELVRIAHFEHCGSPSVCSSATSFTLRFSPLQERLL